MRPDEKRAADSVAEPQLTHLPMTSDIEVAGRYSPDAAVTLHVGDRLDLLSQIGPGSAQLIVTSPPYNIGKAYEKRTSLDQYLADQEATIAACVPLLRQGGSACWSSSVSRSSLRSPSLGLKLYVCRAGGVNCGTEGSSGQMRRCQSKTLP